MLKHVFIDQISSWLLRLSNYQMQCKNIISTRFVKKTTYQLQNYKKSLSINAQETKVIPYFALSVFSKMFHHMHSNRPCTVCQHLKVHITCSICKMATEKASYIWLNTPRASQNTSWVEEVDTELTMSAVLLHMILVDYFQTLTLENVKYYCLCD